MDAQPCPQRKVLSAFAVALFAALVWFAVQKISAPPPPPNRLGELPPPAVGK